MIPGKKLLILLRDVAADRRLAFMLALGFGCGLPFPLVYATPSVWLTQAGISTSIIGLTFYATLAYSFKFAWAPLMDRFDPPVLGRFFQRWRGWLLLAQAMVMIGLLGVAAGNPATALWPMVAFCALTALGGASQDVVVDGWRINVIDSERQGVMLACYQLGYRLGFTAGGAGALYIVAFASWHLAYFAMALVMLVVMVAVLLAPDPPPIAEASGETTDRTEIPAASAATAANPAPALRLPAFLSSYAVPLGDLFQRLGALLIPILLLVALYRLPDYLSGVMANPLYTKLGFTPFDIATVTKVYGVWIGMIGAFAGGFSVSRYGLMPTLLVGGIAGAASNLALAALAARGADYPFFVLAISVDNFAGNFAGTALMAYMSSLTSRTYAATQYALLSSLYALPGKVVGGLSGVMVTVLGYPVFLTSTSLIGFPIVILCLIVWRAGAKRAATVPG